MKSKNSSIQQVAIPLSLFTWGNQVILKSPPKHHKSSHTNQHHQVPHIIIVKYYNHRLVDSQPKPNENFPYQFKCYRQQEIVTQPSLFKNLESHIIIIPLKALRNAQNLITQCLPQMDSITPLSTSCKLDSWTKTILPSPLNIPRYNMHYQLQ